MEVIYKYWCTQTCMYSIQALRNTSQLSNNSPDVPMKKSPLLMYVGFVFDKS